MPQQQRINLADLKSQIGKRVGPEKAQRYFSVLNRFLSWKMGKPEFDKLCFIILGRENIPLHNLLIRSILKNGHHAKVPPLLPAQDVNVVKSIGAVRKRIPSTDNEFHLSACSALSTRSHGNILPSTFPKSCSGILERRLLKDRPSPIGPNGRIEANAIQSLVPSEDTHTMEDCRLAPSGFRMLVDEHHNSIAKHPAKRQRIDNMLQHDTGSIHRNALSHVIAGDNEDGTEGMQLTFSTGPVRAPLGIPFCPASVGGAHKPLPLTANAKITELINCCHSGELCHSETLKSRMEQIAERHGLGSVTMDCANLLNKGLDVYLKRLIKSCVELVGTGSEHKSIRHPALKQPPNGKVINGFFPGNNLHLPSSNGSLENMQRPCNRSISLLNFRAAMELNPQKAGHDWPLILEKCLQSYEE